MIPVLALISDMNFCRIILFFLIFHSAAFSQAESLHQQVLAETEMLSSSCYSFLLNNQQSLLEKIEKFKASIEDEVAQGGYGNTSYGYFVVSSLLFNNPYPSLKKIESGLISLGQGRKLRPRHIEILQRLCQNKGHIDNRVLFKQD